MLYDRAILHVVACIPDIADGILHTAHHAVNNDAFQTIIRLALPRHPVRTLLIGHEIRQLLFSLRKPEGQQNVAR